MSNSNNNFKEQNQILLFIEQEYRTYKEEALKDVLRLVESGASDESIKNYVEGIQARFRGLLSTAKFKLHGITEGMVDSFEQDEANKTIQKNNKTLNRLSDEVKVYETERRKIKFGYDWSQLWWRVALEIIIFGAEISFNTLGFTSAGGSLAFAIIPATGFSIILGLAAHFIPRAVQSRTTWAGRVATTIALGSFMIAVFVTIGILRSTAAFGEGLLESLIKTDVKIGTTLLSLLNAFMFFGGMILGWKIPSKEDRLLRETYNKLGKDIKAARREIEKLENDNKKLTAKVGSSKSAQGSVKAAETHFESLIKSYSEETVRAFLSELISKKPSYSSVFTFFSNHKQTTATI